MTQVCLCACARNEGPYLLEWIAFHRLCGFDFIVIFDDGSTDGTERLLEPLARAGIIACHLVPDDPRVAPQTYAYERERTHPSNGAEWLMYLDIDEFLVLPPGLSIGAFLDRFPPEVSQVAFNWRIFGSSGEAVRREGLVVERFTKASPADFATNAHVKSVTRRSRIVEALSPHLARIDGGASVHADGAPAAMKIPGVALRITHAPARVNHYVLKSRQEFVEKIARGRSSQRTGSPEKFRRDPEQFWAWHDRNDDEDRSALGSLDAVKSEIARLEAIIAGGG